MKINRKVVIIGAGPAGCALATKLATNGVDVLLLDKGMFPRDVNSSNTLSQEAVGYLAELGVKEQLEKISSKSKYLRIVAPTYEDAIFDKEFLIVSRWHLDKLLLDNAIEKGVEFWSCAQVTNVIVDNGKACGVKVFRNGEEMEVFADVIVGADGNNSIVARTMGVTNNSYKMCEALRGYFENVILDPELTKQGYMELHFDKSVAPMYIWVCPTNEGAFDKGFVNVGLKMYDDSLTLNMDKMIEIFEQWESESPFGKQFVRAIQVGEWSAWQYAEYQNKSISAGNGFLLIGDACTSNNSIIEDGVAFSLYTANEAFDAISQAILKNNFSEEFFLQNYTFKVHAHKQDENKYIKLLKASMQDNQMITNMVNLANQNETLKNDVINNLLKIKE